MNIKLTPSTLSGTVAAIPSKSFAHRIFICAALSDQVSEIKLPHSSVDIDATIGCMRALSADISNNGDVYTVAPSKSRITAPLLDCAESGSTLRFLLPVAAAVSDNPRFTGHGRLPERPIGILKEAMEKNGAVFSGQKLPLTVSGQLHSGEYVLPGNVSSQFISGLLMALPCLDGESTIKLTTALESSGYVDITVSILKQFGISIIKTENGFSVPGNQTFKSPGKIHVEGDWSNAAFFMAAGAVAGSGISITGLDKASVQGDRAICRVLSEFGASVDVMDNCVKTSGAGLHSIRVDMSEIPDMLPALSVAAACAEGTTEFYNAVRLRIKESDRLKTVCDMLRALGGVAEEKSDGLIVTGAPLSGGIVDGCNDHRIVMAAAVASCVCSGPVTILGAQAVNKSYPGFFDDFNMLGGKADVI